MDYLVWLLKNRKCHMFKRLVFLYVQMMKGNRNHVSWYNFRLTLERLITEVVSKINKWEKKSITSVFESALHPGLVGPLGRSRLAPDFLITAFPRCVVFVIQNFTRKYRCGCRF